MSRLARLLGRRRRGAVAMVAAAGMVPLTAMYAANMNGGQMVEDRRASQDAADALALSHGTWSARALNTISMNNVAATQLMTVAIGSESLDGTLDELRMTSGMATGYIFGQIPSNCRTGEAISFAICAAAHGVIAIPAMMTFIGTFRTEMRFDPEHGISVSHKGLEALEAMNRALVERHPRTMSEIAMAQAEVLGVQDVHFADPCIDVPGGNCDLRSSRDGMALPIEEGGAAARAEFCRVMNFGTSVQHSTFAQRGFPHGSGPMREGGRGPSTVKEHINETTGIGRSLNRFKEFYEDAQLPTVEGGLEDYPQYPPFQLIGAQQEDGPNSFTRRFESKHLVSLCLMGGSVGGAVDFIDQLTRMQIEAPVPTFWQMRDLPPLGDFDGGPPSLSGVLPPVRPEDMPEPFHILAYAARESSQRVGATLFADPPEHHVGYGQVGLYNPDGADLYSQNWRARLMPATRMDDPGEAGTKLAEQARPPFRPLSSALLAVGDTASWGRIHAH